MLAVSNFVTSSQIAAIQIRLVSMGIKERNERLRCLSFALGRSIQTTRAIRQSEYEELIGKLDNLLYSDKVFPCSSCGLTRPLDEQGLCKDCPS